jgi:hypothetical protein
MRGIGPVCRGKLLDEATRYKSKVCDYRLEFIDGYDVVIIHERYDPNHPKISLTNCVEYVIAEIVEQYKLCVNTWTFVEHSTGKTLFGDYHEYDLVDVTGSSVLWKYLWHNDAKNEKAELSNDLLLDRINRHKLGLPIFETEKS